MMLYPLIPCTAALILESRALREQSRAVRSASEMQRADSMVLRTRVDTPQDEPPYPREE